MKNLKILMGLLLSAFVVIGKAQIKENVKGIHFLRNITWEELKTAAKKENKFIFIDCYATWCAPCKLMDANVYPLDSLGTLYNAHFLSIKVQLDSQKNDNQEIRGWYEIAQILQKKYDVTSLPTFLFLSPDGTVVHRGEGYLDPDSFYALGKTAMNPQKQYYPMLDRFRKGGYKIEDLRSLSVNALAMRDSADAHKASGIYIKDHILKLPPKELYTRKNMLFLQLFMPVDSAVIFFKNNRIKIDSVTGEGFSDTYMDDKIAFYEINSKLYQNGKPFNLVQGQPNWGSLKRYITRKYGDTLADRNVLWAEIQFAYHQKKWELYCNLIIERIEKYGPYVGMNPYGFAKIDRLNWSAWELFDYSTNKKQLNKAKLLSEEANQLSEKPNPNYMDTYANILYKQNNVKKAVALEKKALALAEFDQSSPIYKGIKANLIKMNKGEKTWHNN